MCSHLTLPEQKLNKLELEPLESPKNPPPFFVPSINTRFIYRTYHLHLSPPNPTKFENTNLPLRVHTHPSRYMSFHVAPEPARVKPVAAQQL